MEQRVLCCACLQEPELPTEMQPCRHVICRACYATLPAPVCPLDMSAVDAVCSLGAPGGVMLNFFFLSDMRVPPLCICLHEPTRRVKLYLAACTVGRGISRAALLRYAQEWRLVCRGAYMKHDMPLSEYVPLDGPRNDRNIPEAVVYCSLKWSPYGTPCDHCWTAGREPDKERACTHTEQNGL